MGDRVAHMDRVVFTADGKLTVAGPTRSPQPIPAGSPTDIIP